MGAFLRWLIGWPWCRHEWELDATIRLFDSYSDKLPSAYIKHLRCKKCGDWKKVHL